MSARCPKCGRTLIGAGICPGGDYRANSIERRSSPRSPASGDASVPEPRGHPQQWSSSDGSSSPSPTSGPLPSPSTPPLPAPHPSAGTSPSFPMPGEYHPPASSSGAPTQASITTGGLGGVRVRGKITEVGVERHESVSIASQNAASNAAVGMLGAIPRAFGLLLGILFAPLRMLIVPSLMGSGRRQNGPDHLQIPVTPFVVRADDGAEYDCILRGEARGGFLKLGEPVEIAGRINRARVVEVHQVQSLRTNAVTKGWVDPRARFAKLRAVMGLVIVAFLILILYSVFVSLGGR